MITTSLLLDSSYRLDTIRCCDFRHLTRLTFDLCVWECVFERVPVTIFMNNNIIISNDSSAQSTKMKISYLKGKIDDSIIKWTVNRTVWMWHTHTHTHKPVKVKWMHSNCSKTMEPYGYSPMLYHAMNAMHWLSLFEIVYLPQMMLNALWYLLMAMWIMSMSLTDASNYQRLNWMNFPFVFQILMHFSLLSLSLMWLALVLLMLLLLFVLIHCFQYQCCYCCYLVFVDGTITMILSQCFHFLLQLAIPILNFKYGNWPWILMAKSLLILYILCALSMAYDTNLILRIIKLVELKMWFHLKYLLQILSWLQMGGILVFSYIYLNVQWFECWMWLVLLAGLPSTVTWFTFLRCWKCVAEIVRLWL